MARRIKSFVFNCLGWRLTACMLDGNVIRSSFKERDTLKAFEYDLSYGVLWEVERITPDGKVIKKKAQPYNGDFELEDEHQKQKVMVLDNDYFSSSESASNSSLVDANLEKASEAFRVGTFLNRGDQTWARSKMIQYILSRFTNQSLDAKRLVQDLESMDNNVIEWREVIDLRRFGGGVKLKEGISLEDVLSDIICSY